MAVTPAARLAWPRRWPGALAWTLWALAMLALVAAVWLHNLLVQAGRPDLMTLDPLLVVAGVSAATVGALLGSRRPGHPVGWLLLAFGLFLGATGVTAAYGPYGLLVRPGALPAAGLVALYYPAFAMASLACMGFVMLFTPTGTLPSPRWRWWAGIAAAAPLLAVLGAAVALPALALGATGLIGSVAAQFCVAVLPVAVGAAILRYRLYDLDRIISRTLAYGLLTVLLGGGYAGVVLGLGQLLGRSSSLAVAGATLAVAALFQPARRRVQQAVDRRFNRHRYDATRTIAAFSTRLQDEIDLDTLTAELLAVVDQTMQPTQVSLWLHLPSVHPRTTAVRAHPGAIRKWSEIPAAAISTEPVAMCYN